MQAIPRSKIETTPLKAIKPYKGNPRDISEQAVEAVAGAIRDFGFLVPIVIDGKGVIIAGHTRYAAAKKLKLKEVLTIKADHLSPDQVRAFRIADNKVASYTQWDNAKLAGELSFLRGLDEFDLASTGFADEEVDRLLKSIEEPEVQLPEDLVAPPSASGDKTTSVSRQPKSMRMKLGDITFHVTIPSYEAWLHGIRKANGFDDARVIAALAKKIGLEVVAPGKSTPVQPEPEPVRVRARKHK